MGRPLTALLSRDAIATAALGLVDRTGGFTIVQVADTLGVRPCDSVVIGAALDLAAPDEVWAVDQARSPALIAAIRQAGSGRRRSDRAFALALDLLILGITNVVERSEEPATDSSTITP